MKKMVSLIALGLAGVVACPVFAQSSGFFPSVSAPVTEYQPSKQAKSLAFAGTDRAGAPTGRTLYRWSLVSVIAANGADAASSWHMQEANPLVAGSGTQFGYSSLAIKSGFVASSLVIQSLLLRHHPDIYKKLAWLNYGTAGMLGGVAVYNMGNH